MSRWFWISLVVVVAVGAASLSFIAQALEVPVRGLRFELTERQVEQCRQEGGCVVVSKKQAQAWNARAFDAGVRSARVECRRFL